MLTRSFCGCHTLVDHFLNVAYINEPTQQLINLDHQRPMTERQMTKSYNYQAARSMAVFIPVSKWIRKAVATSRLFRQKTTISHREINL